MADETKPDDQKGTPKDVNPDDNKDSKNAAHWQRIAEERRLENEKLKKDIDDAKKSNSEETVKELQDRLKNIETSNKKANLEQKYPDIEPDLLINKSDDEIDEIVKKQRDRAKKYQQQTIDVNPPNLSQTQLDEQISTIKKSNLSPIEKAKKIMHLERQQR